MEVPVRIGRVQSLQEHFQVPTLHGRATKVLFDGARGCVFSVHLQSGHSSISTPTPRLSHLVFRNYYAAALRLVQVNRDGTSVVLLEDYTLMQHAHCEDDAQKWHVLQLDTMPIDMRTLESLCVYLFQPSPLWNKVEMQHLKLFQLRASAALPASGTATAGTFTTRQQQQQTVNGSAVNADFQSGEQLRKRPSRLALAACVEAKDVQEHATQCLAIASRIQHLLRAGREP